MDGTIAIYPLKGTGGPFLPSRPADSISAHSLHLIDIIELIIACRMYVACNMGLEYY